ncbi:MAG: substrate-binding domain-containing protein [Akkermansiaceae bacterium]|nr:substrate-binding domain-containing protein [Akkermansiaceae bacterium]
MPDLRILSSSEQVAEYLRKELNNGTWSGIMPGSNRLARELGVGGNTLEAALKQLENEGLLISQGPSRCRKINSEKNSTNTTLRIAVLQYERSSYHENHVIDLLHALESAGHSLIPLPATLLELNMSVRRVAKMVKEVKADAWIILSASQEVLTWFAEQETPSFALYGRRHSIQMPSAGPNKLPVYLSTLRKLHELGHRRIVLITSKMRRLPTPGITEQAFLDELTALGLPSGGYNLPDWESTPQGLSDLLDSLFRVTPPTALIIDEATHYFAAQQYLARRGIIAPENISIVCTDAHPMFAWCSPPVAHVQWDHKPLVRRIVRWTNNVTKGKNDIRETSTKAKLVADENSTIGLP